MSLTGCEERIADDSAGDFAVIADVPLCTIESFASDFVTVSTGSNEGGWSVAPRSTDVGSSSGTKFREDISSNAIRTQEDFQFTVCSFKVVHGDFGVTRLAVDQLYTAIRREVRVSFFSRLNHSVWDQEPGEGEAMRSASASMHISAYVQSS